MEFFREGPKRKCKCLSNAKQLPWDWRCFLGTWLKCSDCISMAISATATAIYGRCTCDNSWSGNWRKFHFTQQTAGGCGLRTLYLFHTLTPFFSLFFCSLPTSWHIKYLIIIACFTLKFILLRFVYICMFLFFIAFTIASNVQ